MTSGASGTGVCAGKSGGLPQRYKDAKEDAESPPEDFGRYRLGEAAHSPSSVVSRIILDNDGFCRPPHPARYARHPLPQGGEGDCQELRGSGD